MSSNASYCVFPQAVESLDKLDGISRAFLEKCRLLWGDKPFSLESVMQILVGDAIRGNHPTYGLRLSQSAKTLVQGTPYEEAFRTAGTKPNRRYVQPDFIIYSAAEVREVAEVKCVGYGKEAYLIDDIRKLVRIKFGAPQIRVFLLVVASRDLLESLHSPSEFTRRLAHLLKSGVLQSRLAQSPTILQWKDTALSAVLFEVHRVEAERLWIKRNLGVVV